MGPKKQAEVMKLQTILFSALAEPIGLVLRTSEPHKARQRLYEARALANEPALASLQIRFSPWDPHGLVITKGAN